MLEVLVVWTRKKISQEEIEQLHKEGRPLFKSLARTAGMVKGSDTWGMETKPAAVVTNMHFQFKEQTEEFNRFIEELKRLKKEQDIRYFVRHFKEEDRFNQTLDSSLEVV